VSGPVVEGASAAIPGGSDPVLEGIRVVDLTQIYNGPYCTFLMARAGADVVKVEPPGGENLRRRNRQDGVADPFAALNGDKRSIVVDLKSEAGKEVLRALAAEADVLVENYAPGVMERLGLGADALMAANPRLVYASGSGYGSDGPYRDYPAMDLSMQAMSGVMTTTGFPDGPPVKAGPALCDFLGGIHLYGAIVTALFRRGRTGRGSRVEAAMFDAIYPTLASNLALHAYGAGGPSRTGNRHGGMSIAPYNVYPARDGHVAILAANDRHWEGVVRALGLEAMVEDPRFATKASRVAHMDTVDRMVAERTSALPRDEVFRRLVSQRVPCAPVRELQEVVDDPHLHETRMLRWIEHPEFGRTLVHDSPIRFADRPRGGLRPSPALAAQTGEVLREMLGMDEAGIDALRGRGAFGGGG
jgi:formyl-CoA transferase